jgi:hypothetical protein
LEFLGFACFIRQNLGFSMGYGESKQLFSAPASCRVDMRFRLGGVAAIAQMRVVASLIHSRAIVPAIPATGKKLSKKEGRRSSTSRYSG